MEELCRALSGDLAERANPRQWLRASWA
jgi:hypothetical protein